MDLSWLVTLLLGAVVAYLIYYVATMNSKYWKDRGVVSIYSPPFLGVATETILKGKDLATVVTDIYNKLEGERFGGYFQFLNPVLVIRDPELLNNILVKDFIHFEDRMPEYKGSSDLFSAGLSNLAGDEWRTARHKLTPTFTSGKLKMMFDPISECGDDVVTHLKNNLDQDINARELSLKYIIEVIARVAFGLQIDTLKDGGDNEFYRMSAKFFQPSASFLLKIGIFMSVPKIRNFIDYKLTDNYVDIFFRKLAKDIIKHRDSTGTRRNDFLQLMIDERNKAKELLLNGLETNVQEEGVVDPDDKELFEQLKNTPLSSNKVNPSKGVFTDEFIAAQTFLFISGGSDTTASVLSFILYELAVNKEYQKRVQKEIEDVFCNKGFNYQATKKTPYLDQFINESMRCHPFAGVLQRICSKDYKIPGSDVIINKGTYISIPVAALHKDPQYFENPETFDPDRFEDMDSVPKGVFYNFGYGPRICIAMRLAMLEMKIYLAKILLHYDIVLSEKTQLPLTPVKNSIVLIVEGGIWVKFKKRQI